MNYKKMTVKCSVDVYVYNDADENGLCDGCAVPMGPAAAGVAALRRTGAFSRPVARIRRIFARQKSLYAR